MASAAHNFGRAIGRDSKLEKLTMADLSFQHDDDPCKWIWVAIAGAPVVPSCRTHGLGAVIAACPGGNRGHIHRPGVADMVPNSPEVGQTSPWWNAEIDNFRDRKPQFRRVHRLSEEHSRRPIGHPALVVQLEPVLG